MLASFLERAWGARQLAGVPSSFVLKTLLPAAGQAHMWRGEGGAQLQQDLAAWVGRYAVAQPAAAQQQMILAMLAQLGAGRRGAEHQRPLAQTLAGALVAVAAAAGQCPLAEQEQQEWQLLLLQRLQQATARLSTNWGNGGPTGSYAVSLCSSLLQAAAHAVALPVDGSISPAVLAAAGAWLQQLPLQLLLPDGALHAPATSWLGAAGIQHLVPALASCVQGYMQHGCLPTAAAPADAPAAASAEWEQQAGGLARLALLLASSEQGSDKSLSAADLATAFASWTETLEALYRRPYLSAGAAQRSLLLLRELLSTAQALGAAAAAKQPADGSQQTQQPRLLDWLAAAVCAAADELGSYASMTAAAVWQAEPAAADQAGRAAQLAAACLCGSLELVLALQGLGAPVEHLAGCCLDILQRFAAAAPEQWWRGLQGAELVVWHSAAARVVPLGDCGAALAAAVQAGWAQGPEQRQVADEAAAAAAAGLDAVLLVAAAAAVAAGQQGGLPVYVHRLCWKAAASLLLLQQQLHQGQPQQQRWDEQQAAVLAAALLGLQQAQQSAALAADHRGLLLQLRCCRMLLPAALEQPRVAQLALAKRRAPAAPAASDSASDGAALAAWLCSAAWQAYEAAAAAVNRRRPGMAAAVVATCLHPALFATAGAAAVHEPGGAVQQLLEVLLPLGAKSWRVMNIVSLQVSCRWLQAGGWRLPTCWPRGAIAFADDVLVPHCCPTAAAPPWLAAALRPADLAPRAGWAIRRSGAAAAAMGLRRGPGAERRGEPTRPPCTAWLGAGMHSITAAPLPKPAVQSAASAGTCCTLAGRGGRRRVGG